MPKGSKNWIWIGGAFLLGALIGAYTGLPLTPFGAQMGKPIGLTNTPASA